MLTRARWLASSEVIQVLFTSEQPKKNKTAFVGILSQVKLLLGPLVIQLMCRWKWWIFTSPLRGSAIIHHYSPPLRWIIVNYHSMYFSCFPLAESRSSKWPANNCLQIMVRLCVIPPNRVVLQIVLRSCVIETTLSREKWQIASQSCQEVIKIWKQAWWSNDKIIIEISYRKISRFVSVSQINYLPWPSASANDWSARH